MKNNKRLVLASASPRRREILSGAGFGFSVRATDVDEALPPDLTPEEAVQYLAKIKNNAVSFSGGEVCVSADTVVVCDKKILGKPTDAEDARRMLKMLSDRSHFVYTGVCIRDAEKQNVFFEKTEVFFYPLTDEEIDGYVESGEPMDKAGAYGIQGKAALFVRKIDGDYLNVVGLPLARLARELKGFGIYPECE